MNLCDEIVERLFLDESLDEAAASHVRDCPRCRGESVVVGALRRQMDGAPPPEPPPGLSARVLTAASPFLARKRRPITWRLLARAVGAALVPLPIVLFVDAWLLGEIHRLLSFVLPPALTLYVLAGQATVIAALLALTYGSIPLLAERQQAYLHSR